MCNGVANFSYLKKDGTIRNAIGTLDATKIPSDKLPTTGKAKNDSVQTYYELGDVNNFRCFIKQNLISIN